MSAGVVNREGVFTPLALPPAGVAEELFRRRVIQMLRQQGRLEDEVVAELLAWRHSGFSVHHAIRVDPWDPEGVERLCRYLVHPPIALGRLRYDGTRVTYRGRRVHPLTGEPSVTLDPLEMLARLRCPCGGTIRVLAFILDPAVIRKILQHRLRSEPRAHAPPPG